MLTDSAHEFSLSFTLSATNTVERYSAEGWRAINTGQYRGYTLVYNSIGCVIYPPGTEFAYRLQGQYVIFSSRATAETYIDTVLR